MKKYIYSTLFTVSILLTILVFYRHLISIYNMQFGDELVSLIGLIILNVLNFNLGAYLSQKKYLKNKKLKNTLLFSAIVFVFFTILLALNLYFSNKNDFNNTIPLKVQILITATIFSITGLSIVYYCQKKGFLNYKLVHFILLIFSILFLLGSSNLLYLEYGTYIKNLVELETVAKNENKIIDNIVFRKAEAEIYIDLKENRNILIGYETFLLITAQNYDSSEYSYTNVINAEFINLLDSKKGTQYYWDEVLNNVYSYDSLRQYRRRKNYRIMWVFEYKENYTDENLNETDIAIMRRNSIYQYWSNKIQDASRDSEYIKTFWQENKPYIYTFFSKSKYDEYCKKVVNDLIDIKTEVNKQPNYKVFYETYNISDSIFLTFPDTTFVKSYEYKWPLSFWDRRYEEGNDDVIFKILKEIQTQYQD